MILKTFPYDKLRIISKYLSKIVNQLRFKGVFPPSLKKKKKKSVLVSLIISSAIATMAFITEKQKTILTSEKLNIGKFTFH